MSVGFDPKEENCFNVYWKIKNFSYCLEEITTSAFTVGGFPWCITLRPRDIECRLLVLDPDYKHQRMSFLVSFLPCDDSEPLHGREGTCLRVPKDTIFGTRRNSFLPKDTLTVRFRYPTFLERGKLLVQSSIGVQFECFIWTMKNFSKERRDRKDMKKTIKESKLYGNIELNLKSMGGFNTDEQVYIEVSRNGGEECYCVLTVSVLDLDGEALNEIRHEFIFEKKNQETRKCPAIIKKSKLLLCKDRLLPDDTLSLKCNLALSLGKVTDQTSVISYCKDVSPLMKESDHLSMTFQEKNDSCRVSELQSDLESLLHDGTLSDLKLQVGTEVIQVHRSILSARSAVFKAMFKKESMKNTVVIEDLDVETVRMLVLYLYTDTVPDYKWETIQNLYLAADKYKVLSLKKKCSSLLVANFSICNLCDALILANLSDDASDLKTAALNFLSANYLEVFESEEWKEFENCRPSMALKTLRSICLRRSVVAEN